MVLALGLSLIIRTQQTQVHEAFTTGFRVLGLGFRVWGLGFGVEGFLGGSLEPERRLGSKG